MKSILFLIQILILSLGSVTAQTFVRDNLIFPNSTASALSSSDTLRILAVMVEFQADNYDATIGNGKFGTIYTKAYGDTILDPLPHNADYFSDHLEFAKNYFNSVSKGKLVVDYYVLPEVVTVTKYMRDYWPPYNSNDFTPLGTLSEEAWTIADTQFPNVDFSKYDLFVLFHAGVSNSLDDGRLTLDRNLPSLYLSQKTFKEIYGESFEGFPVEGGSFGITNTIILPETESREYELITGDTVLQELTINGIIVTNIASHLGLPDLFDTSTGRSKIGRFGLMDSQASIANWGHFPPVPSAWEKIQLGWAEAVTFNGQSGLVELTAAQIASANDTTILKVPISSTEYYLIENRIKDAKNDNITLKYKSNGQIFEKTVVPDNNANYPIANDEIDGVLLDVDEYDASLPGNGIVIWHIDENVIKEKRALNTINNDKSRMGVDVEEADGIQDIGEIFQTIFGDILVGEGTNEDFWYSANNADLYENKFSVNTKPNTNSNLGANSLLTLEDFSGISTKMTFRIKYESDEVKLVTKRKLDLALQPLYVSVSASPLVNNIYLIDKSNNLNILNRDGDLIFTISSFTQKEPAVISENGNEYVFGNSGSTLNILAIENGSYTVSQVDFPKNITAPAVIDDDIVYLGFENGKTFGFELVSVLSNSVTLPSGLNSAGSNPVNYIAADNGYYTWTTEKSFFSSLGEQVELSEDIAQLILSKDRTGGYVSSILTGDCGAGTSIFSIIINGEIVRSVNSIDNRCITRLSPANVLNNGENSFLFTDGNELLAFSSLGYAVENYPISDQYSEFADHLLVISGNENEPDELITITKDGRIKLIDSRSLEPVIPYSFNSGSELMVSPILGIYDPIPDLGGDERLTLTIINKENDLYVWEIGMAADIKWGGNFANSANNSFVNQAPDLSVTDPEKLISNAYNYPNPVYEGTTYLRYAVSENSGINIKIFDLSGDLVKEITTTAVGGFDSETAVDVSGYSSGVYFAVIDAVSDSGKTEKKLVKIAVIK